jgi:NADH pyrophosphatase NudC (nudix superfamily)
MAAGITPNPPVQGTKLDTSFTRPQKVKLQFSKCEAAIYPRILPAEVIALVDHSQRRPDIY